MVASLLLMLLAVLPGAMDATNDAHLNDLCFVDAQHGWAVGDRGVVWHTDDGGTHWQQQTSGVTCPLWTVHFHNEKLGAAAGGFTHPYTHASSGVVLTTRNGGQTWTQVPKLVLPALHRSGWFDSRHGWALGCRSAMYPSGVFVTDDGGQSWRPLPGDGGSGWLAADFLVRHRRVDRPQRLVGNRPRRRGRSGPKRRSRSAEPDPNAVDAVGARLGRRGRRSGANHGRPRRPRGRPRRANCPWPHVISTLPPWPSAGQDVGSPAAPARSIPHRRRRPHMERLRHRFRCAAPRSRLLTMSTAGRPENSARSWPRPMAGALGSSNTPAARACLAGYFRRSRRRAVGIDRPPFGQRRILERGRGARPPRHRNPIPR